MATHFGTTVTSQSGQKKSFQQFELDQGQTLAALMARVTYPVVVAAAPTPITVAELVDAALGDLSLKSDENQGNLVIPILSGASMRQLHRAQVRHDVPTNIPVGGVPVGNFDLIFDLLVLYPALKPLNNGEGLPGPTQVKTFYVDYHEGDDTALPVNITRGVADMSIDWTGVTYTDWRDWYVPLPTAYKTVMDSNRVPIPGGIHLFLFETTTPQETTAIQLYSLKIGGSQVVDQSAPYLEGNDFGLMWLPGITGDVRDTWTVLLAPADGQATWDVPIGSGSFFMPEIYVTPSLVGLYIPFQSDERSQSIAGLLATGAGTTINYTAAASAGRPSRWAAAKGGYALKPGSDRFSSVGGLVAKPGQIGRLFIPELKLSTAAVTIINAAKGGAGSLVAAQARVSKSLARSIPGAARSLSQSLIGAGLPDSSQVSDLLGDPSALLSRIKKGVVRPVKK